jgi:hypothetical protein
MRRIYGIDFSGAKDAGNKIWISSGDISKNILRIDMCYPASSLRDLGPERDQCLTVLKKFISKQTNAVFGMDFPFGLPARLVEDSDWESFICSFAKKFRTIECFECAIKGFKEVCYKECGRKEIKRRTDEQAGTPHCAYNLRLYRQTYYGISRLLSPLVQEDAVCVLPMQNHHRDKPWILEICPTSTLEDLGLKRQHRHYKKTINGKDRACILKLLEGTNMLMIDNQTVRDKIIGNPGGDALDSVIAAFATFRAWKNEFAVKLPPDERSERAYKTEGFVYV